MKIRDRILRLDRVRAADLIPNPKNWRTHPTAQKDALRGVLAEVGYADAVTAREVPGGLMLIDGHARAEITPDAVMPVLVLDVNEEEADFILTTLDPLAAMAGKDEAALSALLADVEIENEAVRKMIEGLLGGDATKDGSPTAEDALADPAGGYSEQYGVIVTCRDEPHQREVYEALTGQGYACKVVTT